MSEALDRKTNPGDDGDLKRAVVESLDSLNREGKLAVLEFSRSIRKNEEHPNAGAIKLLDEWLADESGYDEETLPELMEALDRDRLGYRKFFE